MTPVRASEAVQDSHWKVETPPTLGTLRYSTTYKVVAFRFSSTYATVPALVFSLLLRIIRYCYCAVHLRISNHFVIAIAIYIYIYIYVYFYIRYIAPNQLSLYYQYCRCMRQSPKPIFSLIAGIHFQVHLKQTPTPGLSLSLSHAESLFVPKKPQHREFYIRSASIVVLRARHISIIIRFLWSNVLLCSLTCDVCLDTRSAAHSLPLCKARP